MKKRGFTLAEILVSLGVIGVVSALALPTFMSKTQTRTHEATLNTSVTAIENAIGFYMANESANSLDETNIINESNETSALIENLGNYLKFTETNYLEDNDSQSILLKNGSVATLKITDINNDRVGWAKIDTNGEAAPNRHNVDIFDYDIMSNGELIRL